MTQIEQINHQIGIITVELRSHEFQIEQKMNKIKELEERLERFRKIRNRLENIG